MQVASSSSEIEKFELFHASAKGSQGLRRSPPLASRFASARERRRLVEEDDARAPRRTAAIKKSSCVSRHAGKEEKA